MSRTLDVYWEDCVISENEKNMLLGKYRNMLSETQKTFDVLKNQELYTWAIITGYYIMFYKALMLLAKLHNLKPRSFEAHSQVISALNVLYSKKKISDFLEIAYYKIKNDQLPGTLLYKAKSKRNKVNYVVDHSLPRLGDLNSFEDNIKNKLYI